MVTEREQRSRPHRPPIPFPADGLKECRRPCRVANRATLPPKWPLPPRNVAGIGCSLQGRCRANMALARQPGPDSGVGFQTPIPLDVSPLRVEACVSIRLAHADCSQQGTAVAPSNAQKLQRRTATHGSTAPATLGSGNVRARCRVVAGGPRVGAQQCWCQR